tara:strand:+ start:2425 stop:2925 length:501 start_codon:yes stop_codon:yes gene_type:complete
MYSPITRTLLEGERRQVLQASEWRMERAKAKKATCQKKSGRSDELIETNGVAGEFLFGLQFNLMPDLAFERTSKPDFILPDGRTVDVKTGGDDAEHLVVGENQIADLYFGVTGNYRTSWTYTLHGFATKEEVFIEKWITPTRGAYWLPLDWTHSLPSITTTKGYTL